MSENRELNRDQWSLEDITTSPFSVSKYAKNKQNSIFHIRHIQTDSFHEYLVNEVFMKTLSLKCNNVGRCNARLTLKIGK